MTKNDNISRFDSGRYFHIIVCCFLGLCALINCGYRVYQAKKHRRQHNIFKESDKIVFIDDFMHDELMVVAWTRKGEVWMDEGAKRCTDLSMIRHATDEEIKAGRRL